MANQQRLVAYFVLPLVALATAASAQIYGYPIDPADQQRSSTSSSSTRARTTSSQDVNADDTAGNAATAQGQLSGSETRYRPDQIERCLTVIEYLETVWSEMIYQGQWQIQPQRQRNEIIDRLIDAGELFQSGSYDE